VTAAAADAVDVPMRPGAARDAVSAEEAICSAGIAFVLEPAMTVTWAPAIDVVDAPTRLASPRVSVLDQAAYDEDEAACSAAIVLALEPAMSVNAGLAIDVVEVPITPPSVSIAVLDVIMYDDTTNENATPAKLEPARTVTALVSTNVVVVVVVEVLVPPACSAMTVDTELVVASPAIPLLLEVDELLLPPNPASTVTVIAAALVCTLVECIIMRLVEVALPPDPTWTVTAAAEALLVDDEYV
jgi:hypothetical protein